MVKIDQQVSMGARPSSVMHLIHPDTLPLIQLSVVMLSLLLRTVTWPGFILQLCMYIVYVRGKLRKRQTHPESPEKLELEDEMYSV